MRKSFDKLRLNGNPLVPIEHVGRKSWRFLAGAFRRMLRALAEGAIAFPPYVLCIRRCRP